MSEGATVSTHVLDIARGKPASGLRVTLGTRTVSTDENGRVDDLGGGALSLGTYRVLFELGAYFGREPHLFETVSLELKLEEARHYHVPLLISPFSLASYRGT